MRLLLVIALFLSSCNQQKKNINPPADTLTASTDMFVEEKKVDSNSEQKKAEYLSAVPGKINTGSTTPQELLAFANTLIGTPYKYGSIDPSRGFDCSGFITYVFNHFDIAVPRSSVDFTNVEREVPLNAAKPGDLILFTGTDSSIRVVGHMGIITSNDNNEVQFIHSSSGKANGVVITPLNEYYQGRFVKVIRVFKDE